MFMAANPHKSSSGYRAAPCIRLVNLPFDVKQRIREIGRAAGWQFLTPNHAQEPDIWISGSLPSSPAASDTQPQPNRVWVCWGDSPDNSNWRRPDDVVMFISPSAGDETWQAVIDSALRTSRVLRKHEERIDHLERISITDAMTGVFNRAHIIGALSAEYKRFERSGVPISVIMADLDHFKNVNDTYGHSFGDKVLVAFARLIKESMRETDIVGRYGGEEFLCILPGTDLNGAASVARKLREAVESYTFNLGFFTVDLTASFGVASSSLPEITSAEQLLQLADRALYRAKKNGRNQVCAAGGEHHAEVRPVREREAVDADESKPLILIAHENWREMRIYEWLKQKASFRIVTFESAQPVLDYLSSKHATPPHLALIQGSLPPMTGAGLVSQIKSLATDRYFPIVLTLSTGVTMIQDAAFRVGADDLLSEQISESEFERRIRVYLSLKDLHDRFFEAYGRLTQARARLVKAERLSALGQMASGVAHDFNNILSAILGRTQRMLWSCHDAEMLRELEVIHKAASDGAETIRRIQDFSRSISRLDASAVAIADIVEDCIQLTRIRWKDEADKIGLKYKIRAEVDPKLTTSANASELREIFMNLILNALDAMPEGGELTIRSSHPADNERFLIEIADTGLGMEPQVVKRIFEPFFTTKEERGTGLGLSITYGIMTRLGGQIEVESQVGKGTVFRLWFLPPEHEEAAAHEAPPKLIELPLRSQAAPLRILMAEDEASVRDLMVDVLTEEGHKVTSADCGQAAMNLAASQSFDVVITDLGMPDHTGWEVAKFVKARSPDTYVIITSGWGDDFSNEYLRQHGVDRWLPKPVFLEELFALLRSLPSIDASKKEGLG